MSVAFSFYQQAPYQPRFGPVIRLISDMGVDDKVFGVMDTGTEQRILGPHKTDFMDLYHADKYVEMPTNKALPQSKLIVRIKKE